MLKAGGLLVALALATSACGSPPESAPVSDEPLFYIVTATPGPVSTPAPTPDLAAMAAESVELARQGDGEAALTVLEATYASGATDQAREAWLTAVSTLYNTGEYAQAAELAAAGIALYPEYTDLLFIGGKAALTRGDTGTAIDLLGQALEHDPEDYRARHLRGIAYLSDGEIEFAVADLEQAVALGEDAGVVGGNVAFQAMADLAIALAVEDPQAGLVYLAEKRGYYFNFEGVLSGALLAGQGRIWGQSDLTSDAALDVLNRAIQRNYVNGYYYRAEVWARIGERERAIRDLETYLDIRPVGLVSVWAGELLEELRAT